MPKRTIAGADLSGEIEAAGDVLTGGAIARAIEPRHGEAGAHPHGICLNCGMRLEGNYCHACGQAGHVHRTLTSLWHDLAHGVFHFEGKVWRTLPLLIWRPGDLTRRYIAGERARFVSPLALFLFLVFLMFAVVTSVGSSIVGGLDAGGASPRADIERQIGKLEAESGAALPARREAITQELEELRKARAFLKVGNEQVSVTTSWKPLDKAIAKAIVNPALVVYKLQSNAYKFAWALIPLSVPFVWLMFAWKRQYRIYDHAVFVTYSLCFMMLLVITLTLLGALGLGEPVVPLAATLVPPLHLYRQLKGAYGCSRRGALVRTILLTVIGVAVLLLFLMLLLGLGLLG